MMVFLDNWICKTILPVWTSTMYPAIRSKIDKNYQAREENENSIDGSY